MLYTEQRYNDLCKRTLELCKPQYNTKLNQFTEVFKQRLVRYPDVEAWHAVDVLDYCVGLSVNLGVTSMEVLCPAAIMHDICDAEKSHHLRGAEEAQRILNSMEYPSSISNRVSQAIQYHREKDNHSEIHTIEDKILIDADILSKFSFLGRFRSYLLQEPSSRDKWVDQRLEGIEDYISKVRSWFRFEESQKLFKPDEMYLFFKMFGQREND